MVVRAKKSGTFRFVFHPSLLRHFRFTSFLRAQQKWFNVLFTDHVTLTPPSPTNTASSKLLVEN
jgi:hypothetical protein